MPETLLTIVHVSDLHIGRLKEEGRSAKWDAPTPSHGKLFKIFSGLWGHHYRALEDLSKFLGTLRERHETTGASHPLHVVCTGDLTQVGHSKEFELAIDFLESGAAHWGKKVRLNIDNWRSLTIPGNHDHWPGTGNVFGPPDPSFAIHFNGMPRAGNLINLPKGHFVRFLAIDTDVDVNPNGLGRRFALGYFKSHLKTLSKQIGACEVHEVRVLMLHHSRRYGHRFYCRPLVTCRDSRKFLDQFLVNNNIRILLCGHTHAARMRSYSARHPNRSRLGVLECCCGTSAQRDSIPYDWPWKRWKLPGNTVLVHHLIERNNLSLIWETQQYFRYGSGFKPYKAKTTFVF